MTPIKSQHHQNINQGHHGSLKFHPSSQEENKTGGYEKNGRWDLQKNRSPPTKRKKNTVKYDEYSLQLQQKSNNITVEYDLSTIPGKI